MMKRLIPGLLALVFSLNGMPLQGQKKGLESIRKNDLEAHMHFLASDELQGRNTGEPGLQIAAKYLSAQALKLGLIPADSAPDYLQPYFLEERSMDVDRSRILITHGDSSSVLIPEPFYLLPLPQENEVNIEGEVVFAGYGIHDEENQYDDLEGIDIKGKIVLVMTRAPMDKGGEKMLFDHDKWSSRMAIRYKLPYLMSLGPRAIFVVYDPKSGFDSMDEGMPGVGAYLSRSRTLQGDKNGGMGIFNAPVKTVFIHRSVADHLLEDRGTSLEELQEKIDAEKKPHSFSIPGKHLSLRVSIEEKEVEQCNVFGFIEGSDPARKDEMVMYMAHYDHVGTDSDGEVFNGADDNASGTVALLELAEAYRSEKKAPARSVGFLWVSNEEVGLYGSRYYASRPLYPMELCAAAINLDMVARTKTPEDMESERKGLTIQGKDTVKVIGGLQSKVLMEINENTLGEAGLVGNYTYNDREHPQRYFYRSDHISFARKDVPVLFYSTGTHRDYHKTTDTEDRIDYDRFLKMTRFTYRVGWNVATYKGEISVDSPMSGW